MPIWLIIYIAIGILFGCGFGYTIYLTSSDWADSLGVSGWLLIAVGSLLVAAFWPICLILALLDFALYKLGIID